MTSQAPTPPPPADETSKPANPEPTAAPVSPEKHVPSGPGQGHSEHPKQ